jgi:hypothetical protein
MLHQTNSYQIFNSPDVEAASCDCTAPSGNWQHSKTTLSPAALASAAPLGTLHVLRESMQAPCCLKAASNTARLQDS